MWTLGQREAVLSEVRGQAHRADIEELLGRCWDLRANERESGVEYTGKDVGGWIRVRYRGNRLVSAVFLER